MNEVMPKVGDVATGTVVKVFSSYAILLFEEGWTGLLHISELSSKFIRSFTSYVTVGTIYSVKVIAIDENGGVRVSLKQMTVTEESPPRKSTSKHWKRACPSGSKTATI